MLRENKFYVSPVYWHRGIFITITSFFTAIWVRREQKEYPDDEVQSKQIEHPPIFILGHWRSGTTLLHTLLDKDPAIVTPNSYQCFSPRVFLSKEEAVMKRFGTIKFRRPMDRMKITIASPQEDEFALLNLTGLSPYMGTLFPETNPEKYLKYLSFNEASQQERDRWVSALVYFAKKVLFKRPGLTAAFKSPTHTARLRLLRAAFPTCRLVHISRNPYDIYRSTQHLYARLFSQWYLQRTVRGYDPAGAEAARVDEFVLSTFQAMYEAYFADLAALRREGHVAAVVEVRYEDLREDPVAAVAKVYRELGLGGFEAVAPQLAAFRAAAAAEGGHRGNVYPALAPGEVAAVNARWGPYFDHFGYPQRPVPPGAGHGDGAAK